MSAPKGEKNPIHVLRGVDFREKRTVITKGAEGYGLQLYVAEGTETVMVATCLSPDKLGRWALDRGAWECRHDYDLTSAAAMKP